MIKLFAGLIMIHFDPLNQKYKSGIIVSSTQLSTTSIKDLETFRSEMNIYQFFLDEELLYPIAESIYVPPIRVLSEEEKKTWLQENGITMEKLPTRRIEGDPQFKYLGILTNRLVVITRTTFLEGMLVTNELFYVRTIH